MIYRNEVLNVIIENEIGQIIPYKIKNLVNNLMENGQYLDGFDLAIKDGDLNSDERKELIETLLKFIGFKIEDLNWMVKTIKEWDVYCTVGFMIIESGDLVVWDYCNFARYSSLGIKWRTSRISIDGFKDVVLENNRILGKWFSPMDDYAGIKCWHDFEINVDNGLVIGGTDIEFEILKDDSWFLKIKCFLLRYLKFRPTRRCTGDGIK